MLDEGNPFSRTTETVRLLEASLVDGADNTWTKNVFGGADRFQPLFWIVDGSSLIIVKKGQAQGRRRFDSDIICACECYIDKSYRIAVSLSSGELFFVHPANDQYDSRGRLQIKVIGMTAINHDDIGDNTALCLALEDNSLALLHGYQTASHEIVALARCGSRGAISCLEFVAELNTMLIGCSDGSVFSWKIGSDSVRKLQSASDGTVTHIAYDIGLFHGLVLLVYGPSTTPPASKRQKNSLVARSDRPSCTAVVFALSKASMALSPIRSVRLDGSESRLCQYLGSGRDWPTDSHTHDFAIVTGGSNSNHLTVVKVDQRLSSVSSESAKVSVRLNESWEGTIVCGLASPYSSINCMEMSCLAVGEHGQVVQAKFQHISESEQIMRKFMSNCIEMLRDPEMSFQTLFKHGIVHDRDVAEDHRASLLNCLFRLGLTYLIKEYVASLQSDSERRQITEWINQRLQNCQTRFDRLMVPGEFSVSHLNEVHFQLNQVRKFVDMIGSDGQRLGIVPCNIFSHSEVVRLLFDLQNPDMDIFGQAQILWQDAGFRNRYLFRRIIPQAMNNSAPFLFVRDIFRSACVQFDETKNVVLYMLCGICSDHGYLTQDPGRTAMVRTLWHLDEALRSDQEDTENVSQAFKYLSISGSLLSQLSLTSTIVSVLLGSLKSPEKALKASRIFRSQGEDATRQSICLHCQALLENGRFVECLKYFETLKPCTPYLDAFFVWFAEKRQVDVLCALPLKQTQIEQLGNVLGADALILCDLYRSRYDAALSRYSSSAVRQRAIHDALRKYQRAVLPGSNSPIPPPTASADPLFDVDDGLRARSLFNCCASVLPNSSLPAMSFRPAPVGETLRLEEKQPAVNGMLYPKLSPTETKSTNMLIESAPISDTVVGGSFQFVPSQQISIKLQQLSSTKADDHDAILTDGAVADEDYSSIEFESDHDEVLDQLKPSPEPVVIDVRGPGSPLSDTEAAVPIEESTEMTMEMTQMLEEDDFAAAKQPPSLAHHDHANSGTQSLSQSGEGSIEESSDAQSGEVNVIMLSSGSEDVADNEAAESSSSDSETGEETHSEDTSSKRLVGKGNLLSAIGSSLIDGIVSMFSGPRCPAEDSQSDIEEMEIDDIEELSEVEGEQSEDEEEQPSVNEGDEQAEDEEEQPSVSESEDQSEDEEEQPSVNEGDEQAEDEEEQSSEKEGDEQAEDEEEQPSVNQVEEQAKDEAPAMPEGRPSLYNLRPRMSRFGK